MTTARELNNLGDAYMDEKAKREASRPEASRPQYEYKISLRRERQEDGYVLITSPELSGFSLLLEPGDYGDFKSLIDAVSEPLTNYIIAYDRAKKSADRRVKLTSAHVESSDSEVAKFCFQLTTGKLDNLGDVYMDEKAKVKAPVDKLVAEWQAMKADGKIPAEWAKQSIDAATCREIRFRCFELVVNSFEYTMDESDVVLERAHELFVWVTTGKLDNPKPSA